MTILTILLQADTAVRAVNDTAAAAPEQISLWKILMEGGVMMIPLLLCSIVLVYVFVERFIVMRRASQIDLTFMARIRDHVANGNLSGAKSLAKGTPGPVPRM